MAELKTKPTDTPINIYLEGLSEKRKNDALTLIEIMKEISQEEPVIWGNDIIGFGNVHLVYASKREIEYFRIGFAMRKSAITIYLSIAVNTKVFDQLGKHKKGVGCLYINQLQDVNVDELKKILQESLEVMNL